MQFHFLEFEQPIAELEAKLAELRSQHAHQAEINQLEEKCQQALRNLYKRLTPWQIVQVARHPARPYSLDYIHGLFTDFDELHGDRLCADDRAIVGGIARFDGKPVMVIGQQKGRDTKDKLLRNFGMPHPEGYRKALRLMQLAERYRMPLFCFIDTPGAYPGIQAEARGQSEAIARNLKCMSMLKVPILCTILGEGCSGGALGIGIGDWVTMLQYAYYATISPEGCASILLKDAGKAAEMASTMHLTAEELLQLKLIDGVVEEPVGGAHRAPKQMLQQLQQHLATRLSILSKLSPEALLAQRYQRLRQLGNDAILS
jgi:acetyl-CoA carboxylase carboxyl transferase subunit alpha